MKRLAGYILFGLVAACGGGDDGNNPDAPPRPDSPQTPDGPPDAAEIDAAPTCTALVLAAQDYDAHGAANIEWSAPITTDLGDGGPATLLFQFYDGIRMPDPPGLMGTWDLSDAVDGNFATCASCVIGFTTDADGAIARIFFQREGMITLAEDPFDARNMMGTLDGVVLEEVTIASDATSTPVPGGECFTLDASVALAHNGVPNAWTCAPTAYEDGATCDCMCGVNEPDCAIAGAPVTGCTAGQVCEEGLCVTPPPPPPNDTCQTEEILVVNGPAVNGTNISATDDYNNGLEGATCTGFMQPGVDVAYRVALTAGQAITVTLTNLTTTFDPAVAMIRRGAATVCDLDPITCLAGADAGFSGDGETFTFTATLAGNYHIIVDSYTTGAAGTGDFTIAVTSP